MLELSHEPSVYLFLRPADMRWGFDRLSDLAKSAVGRSPLNGGLFVFVSRCRRRVKALYWDRDGYCLWYKRLEAGAFKVQLRDGCEELTGVDLRLLLEGMELERIKLRKQAENGVYA